MVEEIPKNRIKQLYVSKDNEATFLKVNKLAGPGNFSRWMFEAARMRFSSEHQAILEDKIEELKELMKNGLAIAPSDIPDLDSDAPDGFFSRQEDQFG